MYVCIETDRQTDRVCAPSLLLEAVDSISRLKSLPYPFPPLPPSLSPAPSTRAVISITIRGTRGPSAEKSIQALPRYTPVHISIFYTRIASSLCLARRFLSLFHKQSIGSPAENNDSSGGSPTREWSVGSSSSHISNAPCTHPTLFPTTLPPVTNSTPPPPPPPPLQQRPAEETSR